MVKAGEKQLLRNQKEHEKLASQSQVPSHSGFSTQGVVATPPA